jgi:hypothetical protein
MSELDFLVNLVADYYRGDLSGSFSSCYKYLYRSGDFCEQIATIKRKIIDAWICKSRLDSEKLRAEVTLCFESEVRRVCDEAVWDMWLTGEMIEEFCSLVHGAMGKPRADYHNEYKDSESIWRMMVFENWRLVFEPILNQLEKPETAREFRRRCVEKCIDALRNDSY